MTESEVESAVGKPTFIQMDQRQAQAVFPPGSECRKAVVRALIYERRLREDVVIGIDVRVASPARTILNSPEIFEFFAPDVHS